MQTFLEASKEAKSFEEFQEIYPIFDFGKNHKVLDYRHDSFIRGISYSGYTKMRETFEKFMQELSAKAKGEKGDSSVTLRELERTAVEEKEIRNDEFQEARESMIPKEPQKEK